jgi:hypothetical protein
MYYLPQVGELIRDRNIKKNLAELIGWTKLQIIARRVANVDGTLSSGEFNQLLSLATEHKARGLSAALSGKRVVQTRVAHFYLSKRERTLLNSALVMYGAKQRAGWLTGKEAALMKILAEVTDPKA